MSEASDKVRGLHELPLFPLPVVLFPGVPLPLHIFEPRYRQMLLDIRLAINLDPSAAVPVTLRQFMYARAFFVTFDCDVQHRP